MDSLTLKRLNYFQNKNNTKANHGFTPRTLIFKLEKEVFKFNNICVSGTSPRTDDLERHIFNLGNRSFENVSYS